MGYHATTSLVPWTPAAHAPRGAPPIIDLYPGFADVPFAPRGLPAPARARIGGRTRVAILLAALAVVASAAAVVFRQPIVAALPQFGDAYAVIGLPVNLHGVELRSVAATRDHPDGWLRLRVEGEMVNITDRPIPMPAVDVAVLGADDVELAVWRAGPTADRIAPGAALRFVTELADAPEDGRRVVIRFAPATAQAAPGG